MRLCTPVSLKPRYGAECQARHSLPLISVTNNSYQDIYSLRQFIDSVAVSPDISCYIQNIVVFLRLNRAVFSGISAVATRHFKLLARLV